MSKRRHSPKLNRFDEVQGDVCEDLLNPKQKFLVKGATFTSLDNFSDSLRLYYINYGYEYKLTTFEHFENHNDNRFTNIHTKLQYAKATYRCRHHKTYIAEIEDAEPIIHSCGAMLQILADTEKEVLVLKEKLDHSTDCPDYKKMRLRVVSDKDLKFLNHFWNMLKQSQQ